MSKYTGVHSVMYQDAILHLVIVADMRWSDTCALVQDIGI